MKTETKRGNFSGQLGFIMASAGSAVGLGNIWRFPYLAAKDGGGIFLVCYLVLALTFGFALLTTEISIGRKTRQSPLTAYKAIHPKWGFIGILAYLVPAIILPYYCTIGGWVFKYLALYVTDGQQAPVSDSKYEDNKTRTPEPMIWMLIYFGITAFIVILGVEKGIEKYSRILMPILVVLIVVIAVFSLTLSHTDETGITRTGMQGLKVYLIPDFVGMTLRSLMNVIMDAMGQLFFSISVAMGIMITYGSYAKKDTNLIASINRIEIFDTAIAFLAGMMIIPTVVAFMGKENMSGGPGLIFVSLPKIFDAMGGIGRFIGILFFLIVSFAAITSSVSVMEAIVSSMMDYFHAGRKKCSCIVIVYTLIMGIVVCLGYNRWYFELPLPNGTVAQILDLMDYISNNIFMPLVAFFTSILIGWVAKPKTVIDEVTQDGKFKFGRQGLYIVMIKYVAPAMLLLLLLQSFGIVKF